jgi:hypothetical protein
MIGKTCTGCNTEKEMGEFSPHPQMRDGRQSRCKACFRAASKITTQHRKEAGQCLSCGRQLDRESPHHCSRCLFADSERGKALRQKRQLS